MVKRYQHDTPSRWFRMHFGKESVSVYENKFRLRLQVHFQKRKSTSQLVSKLASFYRVALESLAFLRYYFFIFSKRGNCWTILVFKTNETTTCVFLLNK